MTGQTSVTKTSHTGTVTNIVPQNVPYAWVGYVHTQLLQFSTQDIQIGTTIRLEYSQNTLQNQHQGFYWDYVGRTGSDLNIQSNYASLAWWWHNNGNEFTNFGLGLCCDGTVTTAEEYRMAFIVEETFIGNNQLLISTEYDGDKIRFIKTFLNRERRRGALDAAAPRRRVAPLVARVAVAGGASGARQGRRHGTCVVLPAWTRERPLGPASPHAANARRGWWWFSGAGWCCPRAAQSRAR